jgi:two-component system phosphate regulon response regulator PhoB
MTSILLTMPQSDLVEGIVRALPEARVLPISDRGPLNLPAGPAWCFVDWILPDTSGLEVCRRLRAENATSSVHVTMVLDEDDPSARRRALGAGADDYMLGPLSVERLVARVRIPIDGKVNASALDRCGLTMDPSANQVRWQGKLVVLRPREQALLRAFMANPDQLLTRNKLIALAGEPCCIADERTVDVWVGRLRRALKGQGVPQMIRTVRSLGYVFDTPELNA